MKVLITSPSLEVSENVSGIASHTKLLLDHCNYLSHFCLGRKDQEPRDLRWVVKQIAVLSDFRNALKSVDGVHLNLPMERFSIVSSLFYALLCHIGSVPLLVHIRGGSYSNGRPIPLVLRWILRLVFRLSDQVIVLSEKEAGQMRNMFPIKSSHVLSNKVTVPDTLKTEKYFAEKLQLVYSGRIVADKGINELVRALGQLQTLIDVECFVAGSGSTDLVDQLKSIECVRFEGVCDARKLRSIFEGSAIFLLPSYYEGMPNAMLEAMAFGCVPVVTNVGAVASIVNEQTGRIVETQNWQAIVDTVLDLAGDRNSLQEIGVRAHSAIYRDFNITSYAKDLKNIHESLING